MQPVVTQYARGITAADDGPAAGCAQLGGVVCNLRLISADDARRRGPKRHPPVQTRSEAAHLGAAGVAASAYQPQTSHNPTIFNQQAQHDQPNGRRRPSPPLLDETKGRGSNGSEPYARPRSPSTSSMRQRGEARTAGVTAGRHAGGGGGRRAINLSKNSRQQAGRSCPTSATIYGNAGEYAAPRGALKCPNVDRWPPVAASNTSMLRGPRPSSATVIHMPSGE